MTYENLSDYQLSIINENGGILHDDDKTRLKDVTATALDHLEEQGWKTVDAVEFIGNIISATRDNYGD